MNINADENLIVERATLTPGTDSDNAESAFVKDTESIQTAGLANH